MIKDYLLYFSNDVYKDSLYIHLKRDYQIKDETRFFHDVEVLYKQKEPIVYMIHHLSRYTKIWGNGYIYLPNHFLIELINSILINEGLEPLMEKENSGFIIGEIKEKTPYLHGYYYAIDIKDKIVHSYSNEELDIKTKVVVIQEGTSLDEKRYFLNYELEGQLIDAYIVNEKDLSISENDKIITIDNNRDTGEDFFWTEVK
ncbi:MAG: hypothetical protein K6C32_03540 [Bacilli bacterium]|nr:hypothetical protein [Bacilli bacterium]